MTCLIKISHVPIHTRKPQNAKAASHVQVLNLDFCTLSTLPASLGELTALTTLDVEGNLYLGDSYEPDIQPKKAASFPPQLAGLTALRYFNLNSCGLTHVPQVGSSLLAGDLCGGGGPAGRRDSWVSRTAKRLKTAATSAAPFLHDNTIENFGSTTESTGSGSKSCAGDRTESTSTGFWEVRWRGGGKL